MGYNSLDKERKSKKVQGTAGKEKEKAEKELMGMYAYDDEWQCQKKVYWYRCGRWCVE